MSTGAMWPAAFLAYIKEKDPNAVVVVGIEDPVATALGLHEAGWNSSVCSPFSLMVTYSPAECDAVPERWADMVEHLQCAAIVAGHKES